MLRNLVLGIIILAAAALAVWWILSTESSGGDRGVAMPGKTFQGTPPPLTGNELTLRDELAADQTSPPFTFRRARKKLCNSAAHSSASTPVVISQR